MSPKPRSNEAGESTPEPTFDQRLERLEEIVAELEQGRVGLEQAIARYQEGTALVRGCRTLLDEYQKRVEELTDSGTKPYAGDPDAAGTA